MVLLFSSVEVNKESAQSLYPRGRAGERGTENRRDGQTDSSSLPWGLEFTQTQPVLGFNLSQLLLVCCKECALAVEFAL